PSTMTGSRCGDRIATDGLTDIERARIGARNCWSARMVHRGEGTMFALFAFTPKARRLAAGVATGLAYAALTGTVAAQSAAPDFSSNRTGWLTFDVEFRAVPGGPSPVRNDPAHPRVSNAEALRTGKQPTFLISDLSNPNLKPWVRERMKKDNDEVLSGKIAFTPHSTCSPAGVPAFHLYGFQPMY